MARDTVTEVERRMKEWHTTSSTISDLVQENKRLKDIISHIPPGFLEQFKDCDR